MWATSREKRFISTIFLIDKKAYFVDLPGYGYAKVSKGERDRWGQLIDTYFGSGLITLGIQIVDMRHKPTADDITMASWFLSTGMPFIVVANKMDKVRKKSEYEGNLNVIRQTLLLPNEVPVIPFSAEKGDGKEEVLSIIQQAASGTLGQEGE